MFLSLLIILVHSVKKNLRWLMRGYSLIRVMFTHGRSAGMTSTRVWVGTSRRLLEEMGATRAPPPPPLPSHTPLAQQTSPEPTDPSLHIPLPLLRFLPPRGWFLVCCSILVKTIKWCYQKINFMLINFNISFHKNFVICLPTNNLVSWKIIFKLCW